MEHFRCDKKFCGTVLLCVICFPSDFLSCHSAGRSFGHSHTSLFPAPLTQGSDSHCSRRVGHMGCVTVSHLCCGSSHRALTQPATSCLGALVLAVPSAWGAPALAGRLLKLSGVDISGRIILCCGGPSLPSVVTTKKRLQTLDVPGKVKASLIENPNYALAR